MAQYSPALEQYISSVVAVGGDWPSRVQHLRNVYPNNESAFRAALEKQVLAAHEKAKASAAQQAALAGGSAPSYGGPVGAAGGGAGSPGIAYNPQDAGQSRSFSSGRSYPGQQQAPAPPTPGTAAPVAGTPAASTNASGSTYIPYARDTVPQGRPPGSTNARRQTQPTSRDQQNSSISNAIAGNSTPGPSSTQSMKGGSNHMPRQSTSSALNPATAIRQPRIQPLPVTNSKEPLPPYFPISTSQAFMTTYPSRLKLGLTSLVQPISSSGHVISANPRAITSTASRAAQAESSSNIATTLGKRQRAKVDYTERLRVERPSSSSEEEGSSGDDDEDDNESREDSKLSRAQRAAKRSGMPVPIMSSTSTPRDSPAPDQRKRKEKNRDDIGGGGRTWLGQDPPGDLILVQPAKRHILPYVPEPIMQKKALEKSSLIPIRIELDTETHRIRDSFTWNPHEKFITPEVFARIFCLDVDIPFEVYGNQIIQLIKQQLDEHSGVAEVSLLAPEQEAAGQEADLRVILNLDVQVGTLHIIDRVEWDLTSPLTPEVFAAQMCADLGLGGEGVMLISHAVHEELLRLKKDCIELGLVGNMSDNNSKGPKKLESVWRDWNEAKAFVPHLEILSPEDIDALEFEKEKNPRRLFSRRNYAAATAAVPSRAGRRR